MVFPRPLYLSALLEDENFDQEDLMGEGEEGVEASPPLNCKDGEGDSEGLVSSEAVKEEEEMGSGAMGS